MLELIKCLSWKNVDNVLLKQNLLLYKTSFDILKFKTFSFYVSVKIFFFEFKSLCETKLSMQRQHTDSWKNGTVNKMTPHISNRLRWSLTGSRPSGLSATPAAPGPVHSLWSQAWCVLTPLWQLPPPHPPDCPMCAWWLPSWKPSRPLSAALWLHNLLKVWPC